MTVVVIDPAIAGISGDMLLASLIDITGSASALDPLVDSINRLAWCDEFSFEAPKIDAHGLKATQLQIRMQEQGRREEGQLADALETLISSLGLSPAVRNRASAVLSDLIDARNTLDVRGIPLQKNVSVGTLFDILGSFFILDDEGLLDAQIVSTPPALGRGVVQMHGAEIVGPDPKTLEILCNHRIPWTYSPVDQELTTPAGAALLANLAESIDGFYPAMTPHKVGYGAGTRPDQGFPSVLRIILGDDHLNYRNRVVMLETNLDDVTGETIGYTIDRLMESGARDVFVVPAIGKKNRPVYILSVMADPLDAPRLARALIDETGTVGIRVTDTPKIVADRSRQKVLVTLAGESVEISMKISRMDGHVIRIKPEYEDLKRIAKYLRVPLRNIREEIRRQLLGQGIEMQ